MAKSMETKKNKTWLCKLFHKTSYGFGKDADFEACLKYGQAKAIQISGEIIL